MTGKQFVEKWAGFLKDADIENYKEDRIKCLMEK